MLKNTANINQNNTNTILEKQLKELEKGNTILEKDLKSTNRYNKIYLAISCISAMVALASLIITMLK